MTGMALCQVCKADSNIWKVVQCNLPHVKAKEENINNEDKHLTKSAPFRFFKKSTKIKNREELPQFNKEHLQKSKQNKKPLN